MRTIRLLLACSIFAATFAVAPAPAAQDPCRLAPAAPAVTCAGGGLYRSAFTAAATRGYFLQIYAFQAAGPWLPSTEVERSGACLFLAKGRTYIETCGLDFDVAIDPLLDAARITGATRHKVFGTIKLDITITAKGDASPYPGGGLDAEAGCGDALGTASAGGISRSGSAAGSIKVGRVTLPLRSSQAGLGEYLSAGTEATFSVPCAPERAAGRYDLFWLFDCFHSSSIDLAGAIRGCARSTQHKSVSVSVKTRTAAIRITGSETTPVAPELPEPSGIDPAADAPVPRSEACMTISESGSSIGMCGGSVAVEMDPLMRTTRIVGEFRSPYSFVGRYYPGARPPRNDFGKAVVDLIVTPGSDGMRPNGRTAIGSYAVCDTTITVARTIVMQSDGTASGSIAFAKRYGTFRGTSAKPLKAPIDWMLRSMALASASPSQCAAVMQDSN